LAKQYDTALICVTEKGSDRPSLGSLVSLRAHAVRTRRREDRFRCEVRVLKDKRRGPGWKHTEVCRAPDGLR
jgi:recombination protein RecA